MKKLTALILTLVMLVSMTAIVPVSAGVDAVLVPNTTAITVAPGEEFTVVWSWTEDHVYASLDGIFTYDKDVFTVTEKVLDFGTYSGEDAGPYASLNDDTAGIKVACGDMAGITKAGNEAFTTLTFKVSETAECKDYTIDYKFNDHHGFMWSTPDFEEYYFEIPAVTITVKEASSIVEDETNLTSDAYQIRIPFSGAEETTFGFRFISEVDITNYPTAQSFGTLVIPTSVLGAETLTVETENAENVPAAKFMEATTETFKQFNATMIDIKAANYAIDFTYRPYIVLEDGSYVYGEVATANILNTIKALYNTDLNAEQQAWVVANVPGYNA